ncbi:AMP-binding protein, partial [Bacillus subtilis]
LSNKSLAIRHGDQLVDDNVNVRTLAELIRRTANDNGNNGIMYIKPDAKNHFQTYLELLDQAERVLAGLRKIGVKAQDRVILQFQDSQDFIESFWGCIIGGIIPVPVSVPKTYKGINNETSTLYNVWEMLDKPIILTNENSEKSVVSLSENFDFETSNVKALEDIKLNGRDLNWHNSSPDDLALLLFTSGSSGKPKGVRLTHGNLVARQKGTIQMNQFTSQDISLNWMPLEHVGGLVMFHIRDMYVGCNQIQVKTEMLLMDPRKWIDLISTHQCSVTWAPNFAFGLVNESIEKSGGRDWDLSSMRFILNGGEQVNPQTAQTFLKLLNQYNLSAESMFPAWGMSETCSGVIYSDTFYKEGDAGIQQLQKDSLQGKVKRTSKESEGIRFTEVGRPIPGVSMRIVNSRDQVLEEDMIGRIQLRGSCVTKGYFKNEALNQEVFNEEGWFETGDVGFISKGRLTIIGRSKEEIIINGINFSNQDIESSVEQIEGIEKTYTAACAVQNEEKDGDELIIFYCSHYDEKDQINQQIKKIKGKISSGFGIKPKSVIPVSREEIPKTSIGKIQRSKLAERYKNKKYVSITEGIEKTD